MTKNRTRLAVSLSALLLVIGSNVPSAYGQRPTPTPSAGERIDRDKAEDRIKSDAISFANAEMEKVFKRCSASAVNGSSVADRFALFGLVRFKDTTWSANPRVFGPISDFRVISFGNLTWVVKPVAVLSPQSEIDKRNNETPIEYIGEVFAKSTPISYRFRTKYGWQKWASAGYDLEIDHIAKVTKRKGEKWEFSSAYYSPISCDRLAALDKDQIGFDEFLAQTLGGGGAVERTGGTTPASNVRANATSTALDQNPQTAMLTRIRNAIFADADSVLNAKDAFLQIESERTRNLRVGIAGPLLEYMGDRFGDQTIAEFDVALRAFVRREQSQENLMQRERTNIHNARTSLKISIVAKLSLVNLNARDAPVKMLQAITSAIKEVSATF